MKHKKKIAFEAANIKIQNSQIKVQDGGDERLLPYPEHFLKNVKRDWGKNSDENKEIEQSAESNETKNALDEADYLLWERVKRSVHPLFSKQSSRSLPLSKGAFAAPIFSPFVVPLLPSAPSKQPIKQTKLKPPNQQSRAFFEKVDTGFSQKNATKQEIRAVDCVNQSKNRSNLEKAIVVHDKGSSLNRKALRKMSRQQFSKTSRLDLHGLDQDRAYDLLLQFIRDNYVHNCSLVLVITGRGRSVGSTGILRQLVPQWLATAPFRQLVSSIEVAARSHGGEGAFYVRLRAQAGGDYSRQGG